MSTGMLSERSKKELAEMARKRAVSGWETMSKEDLVKALTRLHANKNKSIDKTNRLPGKSLPAKQPAKATPKTAQKPDAKPLPKAVAKVLPKVAEKTAEKPVAKMAAKPAKSTVVASPVTLPAPKPGSAAGNVGVNGLHQSNPSSNGSSTQKPNGTPTQKPVAGNKPETKSPSSKYTPSHGESARDVTKDAPAPKPVSTAPTKDRIIMAVHDPYWLHVSWELSAHSVQRAEAALKQDWYGAKLIIRLYDVTSQDTTSTSETPIRDIPIESDGSNWYINVSQPPRQYRADLGYLSRRGYLFVLARSNVVTPPKAGSSEAIDATWNMDSKKAERILAMSTGFESAGNPDLREVFEEHLKRSLGAPKETGFGSGATPPGSLKKFFFDIDAKLIVFGRTDPTAHLTLGNDPIKLNANGTFMMSFSLPDSRQIIPAVATSADGVEERTIVLAVERNTKYLDPMIHDQMNEL
jgi:hypothetical protein